MAITKISNSGIATGGNLKYDNMLAGNAPFIPNSFESIATVTTSSGTSLTLSSIPQTYKHLQLRWNLAETDYNGAVIRLKFNNDSTNSYNRLNLLGLGANAYVYYSATNSIDRVGTMYTNSLYRNSGVLDIFNYTSTNFFKTIRNLSGSIGGTTNASVFYNSGLWRNTNAITDITLDLDGYAFAANSKIALYGIKG